MITRPWQTQGIQVYACRLAVRYNELKPAILKTVAGMTIDIVYCFKGGISKRAASFFEQLLENSVKFIYYNTGSKETNKEFSIFVELGTDIVPSIVGGFVGMANTCEKPNCKCSRGERHKTCCVFLLPQAQVDTNPFATFGRNRGARQSAKSPQKIYAKMLQAGIPSIFFLSLAFFLP